ncbi:MAG: polysaccharide biosynthesis protein [Clostridia bacterium]|nr:polysaccharide biosynthesis protein [Clostridia bacterium]
MLKGKFKVTLLVDFICWSISYFLAVFLTNEFPESFIIMTKPVSILNWILDVVICLIIFKALKVYRVLWVHAGLKDMWRVVSGGVISSVLLTILNGLLESREFMGVRHTILFIFIGVMLCMIARIGIKSGYAMWNANKNGTEKKTKSRLLIVGAGSAAEICLQELLTLGTYEIVGLVDDDKNKRNQMIYGFSVLGTRNDIVRICEEKNVDDILIAIPTIGGEERTKIISICETTECKVRILPSINNVFNSKSLVNNAKEVEIEDLLCRDKIDLDKTKIEDYINGRVVMVTGGGGSIGSEICRQVAQYNPEKIVILDNYENNAYDIMLELKSKHPDMAVEVIIATVRDKKAMDNAFDKVRPSVVFHAAAHKHVPLMEDTPKEAVKNNVFGTLTTAQVAIKYGVRRFVLISTDKAVNPTNIMGATKRLCEMLVQTLNNKERTSFVAVRFGNVLGSNGSVIPIFKRQIKNGGPVTLTHKDITRFFMTIPEAASLVLQASVYAQNGEIFVLDMGKPVRIYDLAVNLIQLMGKVPGKDIEIEVTGLRPGEKLYEELLMAEEGMTNTEHEKIYIAKPIDVDKDVLYNKLLNLMDIIDTLTDDEVKQRVADLVPTYTIKDMNK